MPLLRNILIFHQGALGDFVLTWPIALALARIHPQSRLFYVTHSEKGKLAERGARESSGPTPRPGWHPLFGDGGTLPEGPSKLVAGAHSIVGISCRRQQGPWLANIRQLRPPSGGSDDRPDAAG